MSDSNSATGSPALPPDHWVGRALASYSVIEKIGQGGMGMVYLARHQSLERLAAIKFLSPELASDEAFIELFLREAKAAARLAHPNIVSVYDAGRTPENIYYFIMEYVQGSDLGSWVQARGRATLAEAVEYVRQAAGALAYAHHSGIVHRDVKPENMILTEDGIIKVTDLGLAKWSGDEAGIMTQHGLVFGSPTYTSPERLRDPAHADYRTDIYSLGATLFKLLTGEGPYQGTPPVIMARHLNDPVPEPSQANADLDAGICAIVKRMMAKAPEHRYPSMDEIESVLEAYQEKMLSGDERFQVDHDRAFPRAKSKRLHGMATALPPVEPKSYVRSLLALLLVVTGLAITVYWMSVPRNPTPPGESPNPHPIQKTGTAVSDPLMGKSMALTDFDLKTPEESAQWNRRIEAWSFDNPGGNASVSTKIDPGAGTAHSGAWVVYYNVLPQRSSCGAVIDLQEADVSGWGFIAFKARCTSTKGENDHMDLIVELRTQRGSETSARQSVVVRGITDEWKTFKIPLKNQARLAELVLVLTHEYSGAKIGTLYVDEVVLMNEKI